MGSMTLNLVSPLSIRNEPVLSSQGPNAERYIQMIEGPQTAWGRAGDPRTLVEIMDEHGVPGVSIAAIKDCELHWAKGYGIADVVAAAPVDRKTLFQAASISKPVAAMAVLRAAQDGIFSMDDDINSILKSWELPESTLTVGRPITPRMLTSHTAGLGDGFGFPGYKPTDEIPTPVQVLDGDQASSGGPVSLVRRPMTAYQYSGGGATIMQVALADALGRSFPEILRVGVFEPVGMTESSFEQPLPSGRESNASRAHDVDGLPRDARWHVYPELAAAGLWTTPTDLARFATDIQKSLRGDADRVLSPTTVRDMVNPVGIGCYAVGFEIAKRGQGWYFRHSGSNWGFQSLLVAHAASGYGFVAMTNAERGDAVLDEVRVRIERAYDYESS